MIRMCLNKNLLKQEIEQNIAPELTVVIQRDDLIGCLSWDNGLDSWKCERFVERLIRRMHDITLSETLGVE